MKGQKSKDCTSCKIYSVCPMSYKFSNVICPCCYCLVKVMCIESCQVYNQYLKNYMMHIHKIKTEDAKKQWVTVLEVYNMRQIRK
jgi:hypothetical protein